MTRFIYWHSKKSLFSLGIHPLYFKSKVNKNKIIYLPNSTEKFYKKVNPNNKYKKIMPKDGPILMFVENIGEAQGFNTIIKSASYLNDSGVKVNWAILVTDVKEN